MTATCHERSLQPGRKFPNCAQGCCGIVIVMATVLLVFGGCSTVAPSPTGGAAVDSTPKQNARSEASVDPLLLAVNAGNATEVAALLKAGADPNTPNSHGVTPLMWAALGGNENIVRTLLMAGANVDATTQKGVTALHAAVRNAHSDVTRTLLTAKAEPDMTMAEGWTPLHIVSCYGALAQLHPGPGDDLDPHQAEMVSPATAKDSREEQVTVMRALVKSGAQVDPFNAHGWTPLHCGIASGHDAAIVSLLDQGANPNVASRNGLTPLHLAAHLGRVSAVHALVARGADVNARMRNGWTAAMIAASRGHTDVAAAIVEYGGRIEPIGRTPGSEFSTAAVHEIAGAVKARRGRFDEAAELYLKAAILFEGVAAWAEQRAKQVEEVNAQSQRARWSPFLFVTLAVLSGFNNQLQAQMQARQIAQIDALRLAADSGTGYRGYVQTLQELQPEYERVAQLGADEATRRAFESAGANTRVVSDKIDASTPVALRDGYLKLADRSWEAGRRCRQRSKCHVAASGLEAHAACMTDRN